MVSKTADKGANAAPSSGKGNVQQNTPAAAVAAQPQKQSTLVKIYLAVYNLMAAAGWAYFIYEVFQYYKPQLDAHKSIQELDHSKLYNTVHHTLDIIQTSAVLEIVHSALRLVKSPLPTTFMQVFSRVFVLWGIVHLSPPSQVHWGFALMAISWSLVEVPRYIFYLLKLFGDSMVPYPLKWLRYTLFIILYPTGITGEITCLLNSLSYVKENGVLSYSLPNKHNFAMNYYIVLLILLALYVPGGPIMFGHMWSQRKKELGGAKAKTS